MAALRAVPSLCPERYYRIESEAYYIHAHDPAGAVDQPIVRRFRLNVHQEVLRVVAEVLHLGPRAVALDASSPLLGAIPELDSMAVVAILTTLEERLGVIVPDDEVDGATFATLGSLVSFVQSRLAD